MATINGLPGRSPIPTLTDWAIEEVRRRILLGRFAPGERLPIDDLARELGISRVPLREAIRSLESEGLIETTPHRGAVATRLSRQDVEDAFALLEMAESHAVERAARASDPESIAAMERCLEVLRSQINQPQVTVDSLEAHRSFHFALFNQAGEGVLLRHLRMLWHTCERYVVAVMPERARAEESLAEHEELLRLIKAGEVEAAITHLREHLKHSLEAVRSRLELIEAGAVGVDGQTPSSASKS
jgi:DNA-binding GntR family transcriptional regulator